MQQLTGIFFDPFPLEDNRKVLFLYNLIISILVTAFLILFKPFGLANISLPILKLIPVYAGYGLVTMIICILADRIVKPAFPRFFDDQYWNAAKHIVWTVIVIVLIGLGNLLYSRLLGFTMLSGTMLVMFQLYTIAISIIPVAVITLIRRAGLLSKNLRIAMEINELLKMPVKQEFQDTPIVFNSDNDQDTLRLVADQFLYAESADNYTDIVYVENAIVRRALMRSSLKRLEEMNTTGYVARVHRAFLANIRKVKQVKGNAQGFRLIFDSIDETIPVAMRNAPVVRELIARLRQL